MRISNCLFLLLLFTLSLHISAQNKSDLQENYEKQIGVITDSAIEYNKLLADTIYDEMNKDQKDYVIDLFHFRDSLIDIYKDSLSELRKDSVNLMAVSLRNGFKNYFSTRIDSLKSEYNNFIAFLGEQKDSNMTCPDCKTKSDYNDALDDYRDLMDSLSDQFTEKFSTLADTLSGYAEDSLEGCKDALDDYTGDLVDNQSDENESKGTVIKEGIVESEPANELDVIGTYDSHYSYRGRDNGFKQYAIAPGLQYQHKSGFGAFTDLEFLSKAKKNPDDFDLGFSYEFDISRAFSIQLLYTHYWFSDSSTSPRAADLNNNLEGVLDLETKHFNSNFTLDIDFGNGYREIGTTLYFGFPFVLSKHLFNGTLTFEPNLTATYGEQNSALVLKRKKLKLPAKLKNTSTFGIMDYEIGIPLTLETKHLIVKPIFYLIDPVNVVDNSTKTSFGDFSLEITIPFQF